MRRKRLQTRLANLAFYALLVLGIGAGGLVIYLVQQLAVPLSLFAPGHLFHWPYLFLTLSLGLFLLGFLNATTFLYRVFRSVRCLQRSLSVPLPDGESLWPEKVGMLSPHLPEVHVFQDHLPESGFTMGFFFPKIYLSRNLLDTLNRQELLALLYHECFHYRQRDPLRQVMVESLTKWLFFFPLASYLRNLFFIAIEKAADDAASEALGNPLDVASAQIKLLQVYHARCSSLFAPGLQGALSPEERIQRLLVDKPETWPCFPKKVFVGSLLLLVFFFSGGYVGRGLAQIPTLLEVSPCVLPDSKSLKAGGNPLSQEIQAMPESPASLPMASLV